MNTYISFSGTSYEHHHNKYDRQMSSFEKKIPTFHSLGYKVQTLPGPFLQLFHFFFLLNLICINKDQWIPSLTMYLLTWCGRICAPQPMMYVCQNTEPESEHTLISHSQFAKIQGTKDYVKLDKQNHRDTISKV